MVSSPKVVLFILLGSRLYKKNQSLFSVFRRISVSLPKLDRVVNVPRLTSRSASALHRAAIVKFLSAAVTVLFVPVFQMTRSSGFVLVGILS